MVTIWGQGDYHLLTRQVGKHLIRAGPVSANSSPQCSHPQLIFTKMLQVSILCLCHKIVTKTYPPINSILFFYTDLSTLLKVLKMEKYEEIFQKEEIDLDLLLTMSEEEFAEIGVTTLGARRRLSNAIKGVLQIHVMSFNTHIPTRNETTERIWAQDILYYVNVKQDDKQQWKILNYFCIPKTVNMHVIAY